MISTDRLILELRRSRRAFMMFIVFCAAGGVVLAILAKNLTYQRPWADYQEVKVAVDDVKGIAPGKHTVRINGVKVGVVSEVDLRDGKPLMTLSIEDEFAPIYRDARLRIRPVTPLQDLYVNIEDRGSERAGEADASNVIPAENTIDPVDISRVLDEFDPDTRKRLTALVTQIGRGLDDGGAKLREAFVETAPFLEVAQRATGVLAKRQENVKGLVTNFGGVVEALAKRNAQVTKLVRSGDVALGELAANDGPFGATLGEIPQTLTAMRGSFSELRTLSGTLDPALRSLRPVAAELENGLGGLEDFGRDALPALRALRPALSDLRPMSRALVPTSQSLQTALGNLNAQAPQLDSLTDEVEHCMGSVADFFQHTLSVFKFGDGAGAFPRAEMTVDFDGFTNGKANLNTRPVPTCIKKGG